MRLSSEVALLLISEKKGVMSGWIIRRATHILGNILMNFVGFLETTA